LVELIVLNVGLESGILAPTLFSMMVCMALATTFMATPLMDWIGGRRKNPA
jgi:Kef-type K+ transport system membrane component KefB